METPENKISPKACHNCRRRRLRCDRSYPHCKKCLSAGTECLGYGKLFRWIGAVASRGKLAGRTSYGPVDEASASTSASATATSSGSAAGPTGPAVKLATSTSAASAVTSAVLAVPDKSSNSSTPCSSRSSSRSSSSRSLLAWEGDVPLSIAAAAAAAADMRLAGSPGAGQLVMRRSTGLGCVGTLVDPVLQDVDTTSRRYLSYCRFPLVISEAFPECILLYHTNVGIMGFLTSLTYAVSQRLCHELIPLESATVNPLLNLIPLSKAYPLLRHTLVAVSASHMSNLIGPRPTSSRLPQPLPGAEESSRSAHQHALAAKHKALSLMQDAVRHIDFASADVVLAAVVFLVNLELIDSGKHGWQAHLRGAAKILSLLPPALPGNQELRDLLFSDCLVYLVMGSAFIPGPALDMTPFPQPLHSTDMLKRAAAYSYNCCPGDILEIIYEASCLSNKRPHPNDPEAEAKCDEEMAKAGLALIQRAQDFDVQAWAKDEANFRSLRAPSLPTRIHAGSAFSLAVCLYILRSMPSLSTLKCNDEMAASLAREIIHHVSCVPDDDPNIKVVTWPTFVAGAEVRDAESREWALKKMHRLTATCPWGFLFTAMEALQKLWDADDADPTRDKCWVRTLKENEPNFVVV